MSDDPVCSRCPAWLLDPDSLDSGLCHGCRSAAPAMIVDRPPPAPMVTVEVQVNYTDLQAFLAMLARANIGHGTRPDYNPAGTSVQVECEDSHPLVIAEFSFNEQGQLLSVHSYEHEVG